MKSCTNEVVKALQQQKKSQVKERKAYEGQVGGLKNEVDYAFNQTLKMAYMAIKQLETLRHDILVPHS